MTQTNMPPTVKNQASTHKRQAAGQVGGKTAGQSGGKQQSGPSLQMSPGKMKILKAVTILLEDPNQKITVGRIARHLSVTDAALYRHYSSKEDIFRDLYDYTESHLMSPLDKAQRDVQVNLIKRLHGIFEAHTEFLGSHPGLSRLLLGQANTETIGISEKVALLHAKIRSQLSLLIKRALADQSTHFELQADELADIFYSMMISAALATTFDLPQLPWESRWQAFEKAALGRYQGTQAMGTTHG